MRGVQKITVFPEEFVWGEFATYTAAFRRVLERYKEREAEWAASKLWYKGLKRAMDVVFSLILIIMLSPLMWIVALTIKIESKGPIFFKQRRVGKDGKVFLCYKFRSMCLDAEEKKEGLRPYSEVTGPVFKMENDPRCTKVGRFIRKWSIDELPQLFNVLFGQMSLVGPRPLPVEEVAQFELWQLERLSAPPGITCTWQVSGRSQIPFDQWMRMDLDYIKEASILHDLRLLLLTIPAVIKREGAS